ncbi:hypothetical protein BDZ91DRAFT_801594 [Kalaharituber pfeilii]|nr:hypothetical protein BDZ91DRAFT_801594 [Kalaharituber pfeilii]
MSAFTDWDLRKAVKRHGDVVERHDIGSEMRNTVDQNNTVMESHDEENPVIERHDEESSVIERYSEVEAHSEDRNKLTDEVQMADTVSLDKSVLGLTSDEPIPRIITLSDDEDTSTDKHWKHPPPG